MWWWWWWGWWWWSIWGEFVADFAIAEIIAGGGMSFTEWDRHWDASLLAATTLPLLQLLCIPYFSRFILGFMPIMPMPIPPTTPAATQPPPLTEQGVELLMDFVLSWFADFDLVWVLWSLFCFLLARASWYATSNACPSVNIASVAISCREKDSR